MHCHCSRSGWRSPTARTNWRWQGDPSSGAARLCPEEKWQGVPSVKLPGLTFVRMHREAQVLKHPLCRQTGLRACETGTLKAVLRFSPARNRTSKTKPIHSPAAGAQQHRSTALASLCSESRLGQADCAPRHRTWNKELEERVAVGLSATAAPLPPSLLPGRAFLRVWPFRLSFPFLCPLNDRHNSSDYLLSCYWT